MTTSRWSGPLVARTYHRLLGLVALFAWISLARQVHVLIGARGLLPAQPFLDQLARRDAGILEAPTILRLTGAADGTLTALVAVGGALAVVQVLGRFARIAAALQAVLYLSFVIAGRTFFTFQWDALLVESLTLAALLPRDRPSPIVHTLFRFLFVKLYFESGVAKAESHLGDWLDGSAMERYYETAPIPGPLAPLLHALPAWWHHLESWAVLALELVAPIFAFLPLRRARLAAAAALAGFQIVNLSSANYGFFVLLSLPLHLFLVADDDLARAARRLQPKRLHPATTTAPLPPRRRATTIALAAFAIPYVGLSLIEALDDFVPAAEPLVAVFTPLRTKTVRLHVANTYHLFGHITTERIEPELETSVDGGATWQRHLFRYKPGDPTRWPRLVAPHQPRVDFQLWFYGLQFRYGEPAWVSALVVRACSDPSAIASLFTTPLPPRPELVRLAFERARFATNDERRTTGQVWIRTPETFSRSVECRR
jgi:hypothetical protein